MMITKKIITLWIVFCLSLAGCASSQSNGCVNTSPAVDPISVETETLGTVDDGQSDDAHTITPIPDTTMENLTDTILSVSLEEGDAYVDDQGRMQMQLKIYSYDQYDMVDIAGLKVGDILVRHSGAVTNYDFTPYNTTIRVEDGQIIEMNRVYTP